jgi:hypothetical protein
LDDRAKAAVAAVHLAAGNGPLLTVKDAIENLRAALKKEGYAGAEHTFRVKTILEKAIKTMDFGKVMDPDDLKTSGLA